jgi:hypothetical protein
VFGTVGQFLKFRDVGGERFVALLKFALQHWPIGITSPYSQNKSSALFFYARSDLKRKQIDVSHVVNCGWIVLFQSKGQSHEKVGEIGV